MKKQEYIERYGIEAWNEYLAHCKKYYKENKERHKETYQNWYKEHKEQVIEASRKYDKEHKQQRNLISRNYYQKNKEKRIEASNKWCKEHKDQHNASNRKCIKKYRESGSTKYCRENFNLIENYELAKADKFDSSKWSLHHRLENYYSSETLIRKGLYYNLNPEALIWLPADEHKSDSSISIYHPELSKWHKRSLENG